MAMERLTITMNSSDIDLFERRRAEMNMNKSSYVRYLISEHEKNIPLFMENKNLINSISELGSSIKQYALNESIPDAERIQLYEELKELKKMVKEYILKDK